MTRATKKSILSLELTKRSDNTKVYQEHRKVLAVLRKVCSGEETGIRIACFPAFESVQEDKDLFLNNLGVHLKRAIRDGLIYDLGVITNDLVIRWAQKAERDPIVVLPWAGPSAVFVATHPEELDLKETLSVYHVLRKTDGTLQITEFMFTAKTKSFLVYSSLIAEQPFGSNLEVRVVAWSDTPSSGTVASVLNPVLMAVAFLAESNTPRPS